MTRTELRIKSTLLIGKVKIAVDEELNAFLNGDLVRPDSPEYFCFFACVEAVDVD